MRSKEAEKEGLAEQLRHSRGVQLQADAGRLELQRELAAAETHW